MFCARCGTPITGPAKSCDECGLDLFQAGAIRLVDPKAAAHWTEDRDLVVRPPVPLVAVGQELVDEQGDAVGESPAVAFVPAPVESSPEDTAVGVDGSPPDAAQGEAPFPIDDDESRNESSVFILGGEEREGPRWLPWAIVAMIGVSAVALIWVTIGTLNIAARSPGEPVTPSTTAKPSVTPSRSKTPKPSASASTPRVRPPFPSNSTKCSSTLAASRNASCGLAEAVAAEVADNPSATMVTATSPVSGRTYTFECVVDGLTICKVGNVTIYLRE